MMLPAYWISHWNHLPLVITKENTVTGPGWFSSLIAYWFSSLFASGLTSIELNTRKVKFPFIVIKQRNKDSPERTILASFIKVIINQLPAYLLLEKYSLTLNSRHWQPVFNRLIMSLKIFPKSNLVENPRLPVLK